MPDAPSLPTLRLVRGHLKASLTKLVKYAEAIDETISLSDLDVRLSKATTLREEFNASQSCMYEFVEDKGYVDPVPDYEDFEEKYLMVQSIFREAIKKKENEEKSRDVVGQLANQQKILLDTLGKTHSEAQVRSDFFLPKIHIEPFSGEYHEWPSFRDMFTSAVHDKSNLTPIQKFLFLRSCLRDTALGLLNHLPLTNSTYEEAWDRLVNRFDRPRLIINGFIKTFMELPSANTAHVNDLRKISNSADELIRGLNSVNSHDRDPWMIYILLNKVDPETSKAWSEESSGNDNPSITDFLRFLDLRCDALESTHINIREKSRPKSSGVKSMHAASSLCMKCNGSHRLPQCPEFLNMMVNFRRDFVKSNKACFNCLRPGHISNRCVSKFRCSVCKSRHHSLVHDDSVYVNHNAASETGSNAFNGGPIKVFVPQNPPSVPSTSNGPFVNNHSLNEAHNIPHTLLPTAIGKVQDIHGAYQDVRILIDSGSQVSFISESCAQRLGLKKRNARIPISGIGSTSAGTSRGLLSLAISSQSDLYRIFVDTYILSNVASNFPTMSFNIEDWDHSKHLELADPSFNKSSAVDILLGAEKVWQKTIFGWVLAGQLPSSNNTSIFSNSATLDVDKILQAFWTIEEVHPKSIISKEDKEIEDHFLKTHTRDSNGRYIVIYLSNHLQSLLIRLKEPMRD